MAKKQRRSIRNNLLEFPEMPTLTLAKKYMYPVIYQSRKSTKHCVTDEVIIPNRAMQK